MAKQHPGEAPTVQVAALKDPEKEAPVADEPKVSKAAHIPKIFWYACAYGVFMITTGIAYTAFRSTNTSLEAFGTKLALTRALDREKEVITLAEQLATAPPKVAAPIWTMPAPEPVVRPPLAAPAPPWTPEERAAGARQRPLMPEEIKANLGRFKEANADQTRAIAPPKD